MAQPSAAKQGTRLGFSFSPVPKDRHPEWYRLPIFTRALGLELYVEQHTNDSDPPGIAVTDDWPVSLCRTLRIDGPQRPAVVRSLLLLHAKGLLVVREGVARVLLRPCEVLAQRMPASCPDHVEVLPRANPWNDSVPITQIRREESRSEQSRSEESETACAREASPSPEPSPWRLGHDFAFACQLNPSPMDKRNLEWIGEQPAAERERVLRGVLRDLPNVKAYGGIRHVVAHWSTFAAGQLPGRKQQGPGVAKASASSIESLKVQLAEANRTARGEGWEAQKAATVAADLLNRIRRLQIDEAVA
jgi:hypothetical protein